MQVDCHSVRVYVCVCKLVKCICIIKTFTPPPTNHAHPTAHRRLATRPNAAGTLSGAQRTTRSKTPPRKRANATHAGSPSYRRPTCIAAASLSFHVWKFWRRYGRRKGTAPCAAVPWPSAEIARWTGVKGVRECCREHRQNVRDDAIALSSRCRALRAC